MAQAKVAISIDDHLLAKVDQLVSSHIFPNRSKAIQAAVCEKIERLDKIRLASECAKLTPKHEQAIAEEGISEELQQWPQY